jgi:hypothetical protein
MVDGSRLFEKVGQDADLAGGPKEAQRWLGDPQELPRDKGEWAACLKREHGGPAQTPLSDGGGDSPQDSFLLGGEQDHA